MQQTVGHGVRERQQLGTTDGADRERFAHVVYSPGRNAEAAVLEARVNGTPVTALCGKRWVPERDPARYPMCPTCTEIRARLQPR